LNYTQNCWRNILINVLYNEYVYQIKILRSYSVKCEAQEHSICSFTHILNP
jgi:hypothetical protein